MQTKWYLRSFVILVVLIGLTLEQIAQPNQQIVVDNSKDFSLFEVKARIKKLSTND